MRASILCTLLALLTIAIPPAACAEAEQPAAQWAIFIHGGAGGMKKNWDPENRKVCVQKLRHTLELGKKMLQAKATGIDVVETVLRHLEDTPEFNAGKGSTFTSAGLHELDASIMDGKTLSCGAVAGVTRVKNPISLARRVMERTPHVLFATAGADRLAAQLSTAGDKRIELVEADYFWTPRTRARWQRYHALQLEGNHSKKQPGVNLRREPSSLYGTVGCVVLDRHGNLALIQPLFPMWSGWKWVTMSRVTGRPSSTVSQICRHCARTSSRP